MTTAELNRLNNAGREWCIKHPRLNIDYPNFKHIGEIPKGCKIETRELAFTKDGYKITCEIDICGATAKSKQKKFKLLLVQIYKYLKHAPIDILVKDSNLKILRIAVVEEIRRKKELKIAAIGDDTPIGVTVANKLLVDAEKAGLFQPQLLPNPHPPIVKRRK